MKKMNSIISHNSSKINSEKKEKLRGSRFYRIILRNSKAKSCDIQINDDENALENNSLPTNIDGNEAKNNSM